MLDVLYSPLLQQGLLQSQTIATLNHQKRSHQATGNRRETDRLWLVVLSSSWLERYLGVDTRIPYYPEIPFWIIPCIPRFHHVYRLWQEKESKEKAISQAQMDYYIWWGSANGPQGLGCAWLHLQLQLLLRHSRNTFVFAVVMPVGMDLCLPFWNKEFLQGKLHAGNSTLILKEPRMCFLMGMESSYITHLPAPSTVLPSPLHSDPSSRLWRIEFPCH